MLTRRYFLAEATRHAVGAVAYHGRRSMGRHGRGGCMRLRNGAEVRDRRLGWSLEEDDRNGNFPVRQLHDPEQPINRKTWRLNIRLNQLQSPSCVGNAFSHQYAA